MNYIKTIVLLSCFLSSINLLNADNLSITTIDPMQFKEYKEITEQAVKENEPHTFSMAPEDLPTADTYWKEKLQEAQPKKGIQQNEWILGARIDGKLVGIIEAEREWTKESYLKHLITITRIYVNKKYQNKGIATQLMISLLDLLAQDPTITALDFRVPSNQTEGTKLFGFKAVNPHEYAVYINGKFYPHYYMKTTMQEAFTRKNEIETKTKSSPIHIKTLTPDEFEEYREINLRALEQNEPHIFAVAPEDDKYLPKEYWIERLHMAQTQKNIQQNLWILTAKIDGKLVGLIEAERETPNNSYKKHLVTITRVFVDKDYAGKGIGKQLMFKIIDLLHQDTSITALELWVEASKNNPALYLYKSFGFKEADPHDYAVQVEGKFYPFTLMATTMEAALEHKEKIQKILKKNRAEE